jgi:hypothetical protein
MKPLLLLFLTVFSLRTCEDGDKPAIATTTTDAASATDTTIKDSMHHQQAEYILRNKIQGRWADEQQPDIAVFEVSPDSIYYIDHAQSYRYKIKADSFFIFYPDWTYAGRLRIQRDTMIIDSETGESRFNKLIP